MSIGPIICGESVQNLFIDETTACVQNIWFGDATIQIIVNVSNSYPVYGVDKREP